MYKVGQYSKKNTPEEDKFYMTLITNGIASVKKGDDDEGVTSSGNYNPFEEQCVKVTDGLTKGEKYYFKAKIKRLPQEQIFYIKLFSSLQQDDKEQYIKTITIQGGSEKEWVNVEFIFSPLLDTFDSILFQLKREPYDYVPSTTRTPIIYYQELSIINNIITLFAQENTELIKIGVQALPGTMLCINGEEIHIGKTGIYELKNKFITTSFFSVVKGSIDTEDNYSSLSSSLCGFDKPKNRTIDFFILDYMY